jgi:hypothetical protein
MSRTAPVARAGTVSRALARDRLGVPSVLAFVLASIAAMTVCAGVIPAACAVTGLTGIPFAFIAAAAILALFCPGYMAMSRRIRNSGSFYAFVTAGLGKVPGVGAALMALGASAKLRELVLPGPGGCGRTRRGRRAGPRRPGPGPRG